ncbi:MAG: ABC transporter permease [Alphaproteobacteria bacterium]
MASIAEPPFHGAGRSVPGFAVRRRRSGLALLGWVIALAVLVPLVALAAIAARGSGELWSHLVRHVVPHAAAQTALLLAGTGALAVVIGAGTAWLVTAFRFPGRTVLSWALLLPLTTPLYIVAYAYVDLLHPAGSVQFALQALFGGGDPIAMRLPDIRSLGGGILMFGFVLYPYVYLTVRASFLMQSAEQIEAARMLGASSARAFWHVALPLARPAIVAGAGLAMMETLGDFGACELLGIQTLTVSVYVTWATRGSVEGAAQIALAMLVPVLALLWATHRSGAGRAYASGSAEPVSPRRLGALAGLSATALCALPVMVGFAAPALHLVRLAGERLIERGVSPMLLAYAWNSARFAAIATVLAIVAGFALAFSQRCRGGDGPIRVAQTGYAVPGTVLAVGLLGMLSAADMLIGLTGAAPLRHALLFASAIGVVMAYVARFLAIPAGGIEAGYAKLPRAIDEAARAAGAGAATVAWEIHRPLLRPAIRAAALLMFVECVKELPATLLLRPLNTETLATFLYGEASRGVYEDGAMAALAILGLGLLPIALLSGSARRGGSVRV